MSVHILVYLSLRPSIWSPIYLSLYVEMYIACFITCLMPDSKASVRFLSVVWCYVFWFKLFTAVSFQFVVILARLLVFFFFWLCVSLSEMQMMLMKTNVCCMIVLYIGCLQHVVASVFLQLNQMIWKIFFLFSFVNTNLFIYFFDIIYLGGGTGDDDDNDIFSFISLIRLTSSMDKCSRYCYL